MVWAIEWSAFPRFSLSRVAFSVPALLFHSRRATSLKKEISAFLFTRRYRDTDGTNGYREAERKRTPSTSNIRASTPQLLLRRYKVFLRSSDLDINAIAREFRDAFSQHQQGWLNF